MEATAQAIRYVFTMRCYDTTLTASAQRLRKGFEFIVEFSRRCTLLPLWSAGSSK